MEKHKTPYLRTRQLQSFTKEVLEVTKDSEAVKPKVVKVETCFSTYREGMVKTLITIDRQRFDNPRDLYGGSFFDALALEQNIPNHTKEQETALNKLLHKVSKYSRTMIKLPMEDESAEMENLLNDISEVDLTSLENTGITRWITLMKDANDKFISVTNELRNQQTEAKQIESATAAMNNLIVALNELFEYIYAKCVTEPTEELMNMQEQIGTRVEFYEKMA